VNVPQGAGTLRLALLHGHLDGAMRTQLLESKWRNASENRRRAVTKNKNTSMDRAVTCCCRPFFPFCFSFAGMAGPLWVEMRLNEYREEGGLGVIHNTVSRQAAS
jgi:hypothetical protein